MKKLVKALSLLLVLVILSSAFSSAFTASALSTDGIKSLIFGGESLSPEDVAANQQKVFDFITETMGMSPAVACGIMANIDAESSFDPGTVGDNGASHGICQWQGVRYDHLKADYPLTYMTLSSQLSFMAHELEENVDCAGALQWLNEASNDLEGAKYAAEGFCRKYERPSKVDEQVAKRQTLVEDIYWAEFGNTEGSEPAEKKSSFLEILSQLFQLFLSFMKTFLSAISK